MYNPGRYHSLRAWGPFIDADSYRIQPTTYRSLIIVSVVFGLSMIFAILASYLGVQQTKAARRPLRCVYVWMIWVELVANVGIAVLCLLSMLYIIKPSFYFYFSVLFLWAVQIHLLLQIIINRIRVILQDRKRGRIITIGVALFVLLINISVFCIWIPARLQISQRYIRINNIWDRIEKVLYLSVDGWLNWYFIRVVKANLVAPGLQRYSKLVRFNSRIIVVSLLMDVMIIGAMSIPNAFTYTIFHPLAYLVKLNIEMTMATLIRKVALGNRNTQHPDFIFNSESTDFSRPQTPVQLPRQSPMRRWTSLSAWNPLWRKPSHHGEGMLGREELSMLSRRKSQLSTNIVRSANRGREDSLGLEEMTFGSVEASSNMSTGSSAGNYEQREGGEGASEVVLAPLPAMLPR